jgi:hypothetical protein
MKNPLLAVSFLAVSLMSSLHAHEQDMEHEHQGHNLSEHQHHDHNKPKQKPHTHKMGKQRAPPLLRRTTCITCMCMEWTSLKEGVSLAKEEHAHDKGHHSHGDHHSHAAIFDFYPATREASGTSWQPDSAPHEGISGMFGKWATMLHGAAFGIYDDQGGRRGDEKAFHTSDLMFAQTARPWCPYLTLGASLEIR